MQVVSDLLRGLQLATHEGGNPLETALRHGPALPLQDLGHQALDATHLEAYPEAQGMDR